jgi:hypothetical protein
MCGSNNREEADRRPLALCPECAAKVCWATGADPVERYRRLAEFCKRVGLEDEAVFYGKCLAALGGAPEPAGDDSSKPARPPAEQQPAVNKTSEPRKGSSPASGDQPRETR